MNIRRYICVTDLEATCQENKYTAGPDGAGYVDMVNEVIEIGVVMVDTDGGKVVPVREFKCVVKPVINPELTPFCTELTGITQAEVDKGLPFAKANEEFRAWMGDPEQVTFASWGKYDDTQYRQDCEYHKVTFPFTGEHFNVKDHFCKKTGAKRGKGQLKAVRSLGLTWVGPRHRALSDARMAAAVLAKVGL